jgi:OOP family OmpA-OmpF porin
MMRSKNLLSWVVTFGVVVVLAALVGCRPPPPPAPPPPAPVYTAPVAATPTYRPTTEEWVHLPVRLVYPTGGSRLSDEHRAMLREAHASLANRTDIVRIRVEGHTDERGNRELNEQLSMERAQSVVDYLVGDLGLPRELFEARGFGEEAPVTSGTTASDRVQNRRVEFSILVRRQAAP